MNSIKREQGMVSFVRKDIGVKYAWWPEQPPPEGISVVPELLNREGKCTLCKEPTYGHPGMRFLEDEVFTAYFDYCCEDCWFLIQVTTFLDLNRF